MSLGKGGKELLEKIIPELEGLINDLNEENTFSKIRLLDLLIEFGLGDSSKYANLSKSLAENSEKREHWREARESWEINARWNKRLKNEQAVKDALVKSAETHEREAEASTSKMIKASFLQKAIAAHRKAGGQQEKVKELHQHLLEVQSGIKDELASFESEFDISELVTHSKNIVKGRSFRDAIFNFCKELRPLNFNSIKDRTEDLTKKHPLTFLTSGVVVDEEGKTVAVYPNLMTGDEEERQKALLTHIHNQSEQDILVAVQGLIEPIRKQILIEHTIRESDFRDIVRSSPIVPPGREYLFTKAIYKGFIGDFVSSTDTLVTQFEHSVRYILKSHGVVSSGIDDSNIQDDRSLNTTLAFGEVEKIFGKDIAFTLRNVLTNKFGGNLRNKVAHGLMWPGSYYSHYPVYFWAFTLRLIVWPVMVDFYKNSNEGVDIHSSEDEDEET